MCAVKDTVLIRRVKLEKERVKELVIQEILDKHVVLTLDQMDVGASFGRILF